MPPKTEKKVNVGLLAVYMIAWYTLNVQYNLYNKKILNAFPYPYMVSLSQLASGIIYILPVWALGLGGRSFPSGFSVPKMGLLGFFHGSGHFATVISLGAGSVAFANVVKAAEPFCSVLMGVLMTASFPPLMELLSLTPIIAGVMIASMAEPEFSQTAFIFAMGSNLLFAARGTLAKLIMSGGPGTKKIGGADVFALNTLFALVIMLPLAIYMEGAVIQDAWAKYTTGTKAVDFKALMNGELDTKVKPSPEYFAAYMLVCGLYYYTYNEMAFMVLDLLDPVGQAVGNTVKRVVIIIAGTIVFNKPLTQQGIIGSSVAIGGVLVYSLVKAKASAPKAKKA
uniref:Sugar phosphate transporter domain-containing protein n=1 Tax=Hemiselmis andersenii TaxID=464988 RepID=A0A6U2FK39_HEMAN